MKKFLTTIGLASLLTVPQVISADDSVKEKKDQIIILDEQKQKELKDDINKKKDEAKEELEKAKKDIKEKL